jgi:endoglucanase
MSRIRTARTSSTRLAAIATAGALAAAISLTVTTGVAHATTPAQIRLDQAGYLPSDTKQAYLMATGTVSGATYQVVNSAGGTVLTGTVGATSLGSWNSAYPDVYPINVSALNTPGTYRIKVSGGTTATSPTFTVTNATSLYGPLVADGVTFFQTQRDGANVIPGALNRQPSHLNDATASIYRTPDFASGGSDTITDSDLTRIGGPVNVEGGWFDAGDFLKFTYTTAYADVLLGAAQRGLGTAAPAALSTEAQYGTSWLNQMWNQSSRTLYLQVGIGSGNSAGTFTGDHDLWRLPQADDSDSSSADRYSAAHRPVFEAAAPGTPISPNLAGRVAAAFAIAAQNDATANPTRAAAEYRAATSLYAMANTSNPPNPLVTTLPNAYYPESIWHDGMELGAAEIALAAESLGDDPANYLSQAATWAQGYITGDTGDTFNLYDVSALAHADLIKAMAGAGNPTGSGLAVSRTDLVNDLARQLRAGQTHANADPFRAGANYADFDVDSHTFGLMTTEALYEQATGSTSYRPFATEQRDWVFGANAWGSSFMVGVGSTFPHCMQHQVANLSGSTNGTAPIATGAVVNGPNGTSNFNGGLGSPQDGMVTCENDGFTTYDGHGSEYVDDVRAWQTSEPALDMSGGAVLAAALQQAVNTSTPPPGNDFSLTLSPNAASVAAGGSTNATVSTAVTSGASEPVTLAATGLPTGASASFNPTQVASGATATLTVSTASSTPAGTYPISVTGTAASGSHTATYTLTVTGTSGGCTAAQLLGNPGFENGANPAPWTQTSTLGQAPVNNDTADEPAHSGGWDAWLNGDGKADTDTVAQTVTLPAACTTASFSFWLHIDTTEKTTSNQDETLRVQILNSAGTVLDTLATYSNLNANTGYAQHTFTVSAYAGQTITVKFTGTETDADGGTTNFVIDDTALNVS